MHKTISKQINVSLQLSYSEMCNLLRGGIVFADIHKADLITDQCLDDFEENRINNLHINIKIHPESIKGLEFMKTYLEQKEKHDAARPA